MKRLSVLWFAILSLSANAQTSIPSYPISVTFQKTTNIIFPYRIEKADIGSPDVIGHKDDILGNVLFLKAGRKGFIPTNLSVYTSDGKFYSFVVRYREETDTLNLSFIESLKSERVAVDSFMDARLDSDAIQILNQPRFLHRKTKTQELKVILDGIYLKDQMIWLRIKIKNHSEIAFRPEYLRFSSRDKKAGKRTAIQENQINPAWKRSVSVDGVSQNSFLFGFPEFTLAIQKKLVIQMEEKNGGRTILLEIPARILLKAK